MLSFFHIILSSHFFVFTDNYDYAVPELGTMPLLAHDSSLQHPIIGSLTSEKDTIFSKISSSNSKGSKSEEGKGKKVID